MNNEKAILIGITRISDIPSISHSNPDIPFHQSPVYLGSRHLSNHPYNFPIPPTVGSLIRPPPWQTVQLISTGRGCPTFFGVPECWDDRVKGDKNPTLNH